MRTVLCKMQCLNTSHKSSETLKNNRCNNLVFSALGTSDLSKLKNMKRKFYQTREKKRQGHITKQLVHFFWLASG